MSLSCVRPPQNLSGEYLAGAFFGLVLLRTGGRAGGGGAEPSAAAAAAGGMLPSCSRCTSTDDGGETNSVSSELELNSSLPVLLTEADSVATGGGDCLSLAWRRARSHAWRRDL